MSNVGKEMRMKQKNISQALQKWKFAHLKIKYSFKDSVFLWLKIDL